MKQMYLILGSAVCMLALACTKETPVLIEESPVKLVPITFTVDNQATKTSLDYYNEKAVIWTSGDRVAIFDNNGGKVENQSFEVANDKIEAMVHDGATEFYALYPYNASATISGNNVVTTYIPSEQTAVEGSFGNNVNVAVAHTTTEDKLLTFKNTCALLKFTIGMDNVQSITITANGDYHMTGRSSITYSDGSVTSVSCEGSHSVTLTGPLTNGSTYFVAVAPQTYYGGISMMIVKTGGTVLVRKGDSELVTEMGTIKSLGTLSTGFTECDGYYGAYKAGMPLEICGEYIAAGGTCKLVDVGTGEGTYDLVKDSEDKNIIHGYNGIVFVKGSKQCILGSQANVYSGGKKLVIVGNTPGQRANINSNGQKIVIAASSSLFMRNVQFTSTTNYSLSPGSATVGKIYIDDCTLPGDKQLVYTSGSGGANSIKITNCLISLPATVGSNKMQLVALGNMVVDNYGELVFSNNIVVSPSTPNELQFITSSPTGSSATSPSTRIEIKNNVFYNCLHDNGLLSIKTVPSAMIEGNIFFIASSATNKQKVLVIHDKLEDTSGISWTSNCYYYGGSNSASLSYAKNGPGNSSSDFLSDVTLLAESPFSSFDTSTGAYVLKPDYVGYGPQK